MHNVICCTNQQLLLWCDTITAWLCWVTWKQVTWLVVTEVRSKSFRLIAECCPSLQRTSYLCVGLLCCASSIFNHRVWYHELSLCYMHIRRSGIILTPPLPLCQILFVMPSTARLACGEKSRTQSLTHPAYLMLQKRSAQMYYSSSKLPD